MGVSYEWAEDNDVILYIHIEFPWTLHEYTEKTTEVMHMLRDLGSPCATIVDVTKMGGIPKDGNVIQALVNIEKQMPDNLFASAVVGMSYSTSIFMNILTGLRPGAKRRAIFAKTMDEAREKVLSRYQEFCSMS